LLKDVPGIIKIKGKPIKYAFHKDAGPLFRNIDESKIPEM
jgi:hypothetical protein